MVYGHAVPVDEVDHSVRVVLGKDLAVQRLHRHAVQRGPDQGQAQRRGGVRICDHHGAERTVGGEDIPRNGESIPRIAWLPM